MIEKPNRAVLNLLQRPDNPHFITYEHGAEFTRVNAGRGLNKLL